MKAILVLLTLVVMHATALAGIETYISFTNQVVLEWGIWTPTPEEVHKALLSIQSILERPGTTDDYSMTDIKMILKHTKEYRVQFLGAIRDGKKVIWCNFFPAPRGGRDDFQDWKQEKVKVEDGGFWFWHIDYDLNTNKCLEFHSNGVA